MVELAAALISTGSKRALLLSSYRSVAGYALVAFYVYV